MAWFLLIVAGGFEIAWALGLKYTEGFTRPWHTAWVAVALIISVVLPGFAVREIGIGTAYAVWTAMGIVGTTVGGIWLFGEPRDALRLACVGLVLVGVVGLKVTDKSGVRGGDVVEGRE